MDAGKEIDHVNRDLGACSYLRWSFKRVREQLDQQEWKHNGKIIKKDSKYKSTKTRVTLPYSTGVSEALSRDFCHHAVATLIKPHLTLKKMLVHPKDIHTPQDKLSVV